MGMRELTSNNFVLYAANHYDNPSCIDQKEFAEDISRIKSINRLFGRYEKTGELRERLILNHLRILFNVFEHRALVQMLCFKLNKQLHLLKPFLIMLSYWPKDRVLVGDTLLNESDIIMDQNIVDALRKI